MKPGFRGRAALSSVADPKLVLSDGSDARLGLPLWSRPTIVGEDGASEPTSVCPLRASVGVNRKMWTVSVAEDTQRSVLVALNDMQCILAGMLPLLNWYSFCPEGIANTRITVPFSDAVASSVPSLFIAILDNGA